MCDVLIPALIGVGALALLGGGGAVAGGCDNCPTGPVCAVTQYGNYTVTIPQLAGEGTNVQQVYSNEFAYAPPMQQGYAPYGGQPAGPAPYAAQPAPAPAPAYNGIGHYDATAPAGYGQPSASGYVDPSGAGVGANIGGFNAGVDVDARTY